MRTGGVGDEDFDVADEAEEAALLFAGEVPLHFAGDDGIFWDDVFPLATSAADLAEVAAEFSDDGELHHFDGLAGAGGAVEVDEEGVGVAGVHWGVNRNLKFVVSASDP